MWRFYFVLAVACRSSQARNQTHTTAVTQAAAMTRLEPYSPLCQDVKVPSISLFFLATLQRMEFLGQRLDLSPSCDLCCGLGNAVSLTHCVGLGIEPVSLCCRNATDPIVPQQGIPESFDVYLL